MNVVLIRLIIIFLTFLSMCISFYFLILIKLFISLHFYLSHLCLVVLEAYGSSYDMTIHTVTWADT